MNTDFSPELGGVLMGRRIEWFHAASLPEWGYREEREDTFALIYPLNFNKDKQYPLYVVFHSAGHDVYSAVACCWQAGNHDLYHTPKDMFGLYLDCRQHESDDWWWGGNGPNEIWGEGRDGTELQPVERRSIATVEHIIESFPIDRQRVYAAGISMGGSGAMGIAMRRGDIFASVCVDVPAGVRHVMARCSLKNKDKANIPDPPVLFDYSAQNDSWSEGHGEFYVAMRDKKYPLIGYWGAFGHENSTAKIKAVNNLILSYDPFVLRKDQVYPVFTNSSSDDMIPWGDSGLVLHQDPGQLNGFFRWEDGVSERCSVSVAIWLDGGDGELLPFPDEVMCDVTLRRVANCKFAPGEKVLWSYGEAHGFAFADEECLVTVTGLKITKDKKRLVLRKQ